MASSRDNKTSRATQQLAKLRLTGGVERLCVLFGDQLDHDSVGLAGLDPQRDGVLMIEAAREAEYIPSHKLRTTLFLSAMRHFALELSQAGWRVDYVRLDDADNTQSFEGEMERGLTRLSPGALRFVRPGNWRVFEMITRWRKSADIEVELVEDAHFYLTPAEFDQWADGRKTLVMEHFYRMMRKRLGVLLDANGQPTGGEWNYDQQNRASFTGDPPPQVLPSFPPDALTRDVMALVERRWADAPGSTAGFDWPVTRGDALAALDEFIGRRLLNFGEFQDAMATGEPWMFHAVLSPALNLKLLNPRECVAAAERAYAKGRAPLNAVEGFIRQLIGWREFIRGVYWRQGARYAKHNTLQHQGALPEFYWSGTTKMNCLRQCVGQVVDYGYAHHIQRLMVLGNFALLAGVRPQDVDAWFVGMFVDGIEWVTTPNVIGMSQHADGGIVGTKPYVAGGRYINKMSDYCKHCHYKPDQTEGESACPFSVLYWDFLRRHARQFAQNRRMAPVLANWRRMAPQRRRQLARDARALREAFGLVAGSE